MSFKHKRDDCNILKHTKYVFLFLPRVIDSLCSKTRYEECGKYLKDEYNVIDGQSDDCFPAVFSSVRISTIPAFGTIMETVTQKEVYK